MSQRSEKVLLLDAAMHATAERESQSKLIVDIAEIDARKVYRDAGYDSIHSYCVRELGLSERAAAHRIWVARVAWKYPCVLGALSECTPHMSAVRLLAAHLTKENADELVEAAANKTALEIEELLRSAFQDHRSLRFRSRYQLPNRKPSASSRPQISQVNTPRGVLGCVFPRPRRRQPSAWFRCRSDSR